MPLGADGWAAPGDAALPAGIAALLWVPYVTPGSAAIPALSCERGELKFSLESALSTNSMALMGLHTIFCFLSRSDPGDGSGARAESRVGRRGNAR